MHPPLQVTDILAYETWKEVCNGLLSTPRKMRFPLLRLSNVEIMIKEVDRNVLKVQVEKKRAARP